MAFSDPIQDTYFSHPAFEAYPVVNISYEAAQAYCQWLTSQYHADEKRTYKQVIIRLPSEEEWEQAALKAVDTSKWGAIFPWNGYRLVDDKGRPLANFKYVHQAAIKQSPFQEDLVLDPKIKKKFTNYSEDGYMVTSPVNGFPVNPAGFYNLGGNACEMLSERGKAKGGSWASTGYYLRVHSVENYEQPTPFLGFRCFVEVVEE
jgi:sulfatase modifying factor 1